MNNEDARNLNDALLEQLRIREKSNQLSQAAIDLETEFLESIKNETDVKNQIEEIDDQILKLKQLQLQTDDASLKILIDQYSKVKGVLSLLDKKKDLSDKIKDNFLDMFGATSDVAEIFRTGGLLYAGSEAFKNSAEAIKDAFSNTFGTAFEMYKTMGISAKEGGVLAGEIGKASFSMAGLLYGGEAMAESSKALVDQFGNVNMATSDMVEGVTEINALVGDAAKSVELALAFQNAGVAVDEVDDVLKDIGSKTGVTATKIAKEMADNQYLMVGATKQELKLIGQLNAELIKQGATRESIRGSAKSLMDIENTIQQANKIALMTGKMVNTSRLTEAAMQARIAEGAENKAKAQNELLRALKEELGVNGNISDQSDVTIEAMTSLSGLTEEQLLNMEQAGIAQKNNNTLMQEGNAFIGGLTAGAISFGAGIGSATLELIKMIAQAAIFNRVMNGSFGMDNLLKLRGKDNAVDGGGSKVGRGGGGRGGGDGIMNKVGSMGSGVGGALKGIAGGFAAFATPQVIVGVAIITGAIIGLGFALKLAAPGIEAIGKAIATVIGSVGDFIVKIAQIASPEVGLGLLSLALGFAALSTSLAAFAITGVAAIPAMTAVGVFTAAMTALGVESSADTKKSDPLLEEIRGLRADIKAQPINVVLNNKIVGEINRSSRAINSYVNKA